MSEIHWESRKSPLQTVFVGEKFLGRTRKQPRLGFGRAADLRRSADSSFSAAMVSRLPPGLPVPAPVASVGPAGPRGPPANPVHPGRMSIPNWCLANEERDAENWLHHLRDHGAGDLLGGLGAKGGTGPGTLVCVGRQQLVQAAKCKGVQAIKFYNCFGDAFPGDFISAD